MEDTSHKQHNDELYKTVRAQFVSEGLLRELRCDLQTRIINMMRGELQSGESLCGANLNEESKVLGGLDDRGMPHGDMRIMITNQLIMEYLHWYGYKYTAQMLSMETGTDNKPPLRASLEGMVGPTKCHQLPIVLEIVAKMVQNQQRRIERGAHALDQEESCTSIVNSKAQDTPFVEFRPVVSFEKPLDKNTEACVDERSQRPLRKKSKAPKKHVHRSRDTDINTVVLSNQKDKDIENGSGNYLNSPSKVSIKYEQSYHSFVDEEISDNCSVEVNFCSSPTGEATDDQTEDYIDKECDGQSDTKNTHALNQIMDNIETSVQQSIEPLCLLQEQLEGLETKNTLEQLEPDYFETEGNYADEEDENSIINEDNYEDSFDEEDYEYLDNESYNKKIRFLQREFQMAMQRNVDRRADEDDTNDDDSDCTNGELQSDEDVSCPYQNLLKDSNDEFDEEEED